MLPLSGYPHVPEKLPIREALLALGASSVVSSTGHLVVPRYLLVLDDNQRLVGVVNRRALLRGLIPQYASLKRASAVIETLPYAESLSATTPLWSSLFSPGAAAAARKPVGSVMVPTRVSVADDDPWTPWSARCWARRRPDPGHRRGSNGGGGHDDLCL